MTSSSDDFSHLPTAGGTGGVDKQALWRQHRREKSLPPARSAQDTGTETGDESMPPANEVHEEGSEKAHHEPALAQESSWQELLEAHSSVDSGDEWEARHEEHHSDAWLDEEMSEEAHHDAGAHEGPPPIEAAEPPPADNTPEIRRSAKRALIITIALHIAVALTLTLMHTAGIDVAPAEIVAVSGVEQQESPTWKKITTATPQAAPMPSISPLLATGASDFAMPEVDFDTSAAQLNLGTSFGSFGTAGATGKISFLGNTAKGRNIVYVVDLSSSMLARSMIEGSENSVSRFELMQKELRSSVGRLSSAVQYQILFFADYAIAHDAADTKDYAKLQPLEWTIRAGQKDVKIPRYQYLQGSRVNVTRSQKIIEECATMGGTNWGSGLRMALNGSPKPDVIFFMTDGDAGDEQGWSDDISEHNSRGKRTIIHTTAMMVPGAADALSEIARRNGGTFTIVMPSGKVLTGEQYFKQRGR